MEQIACIKNAVLDFFFPVYCVGCGKEKTHLCAVCFSKNIILKNPFQKNKSCFAFDGIIAAAEHRENSAIAELIHRFKYDGAKEIGGILNLFFAKMNLEQFFNKKKTAIIPVPLHPKRFNSRGFNQSEILADEIAKYYGFETHNILKRHRYTRPQVELNREERLKNLRGAFSLKDPDQIIDPNAEYVIVDDVSTTGATIHECAKVLKTNGAKKVFGLVTARAV